MLEQILKKHFPTITDEILAEVTSEIKKQQATDAANLLNHMLEKDPRAVSALLSTNFICSLAIADTDVFATQLNQDLCSLGILGLLQGVIGSENIIRAIPHEVVGLNTVSVVRYFTIQPNAEQTS